jgi:hypothetical protein
MASIAAASGFQATSFLNENATAANVLRALSEAAQSLDRDDIFLITYAGHGAQIPDANGDEEDGLDETWCLYDRMLIDDELYRMWTQFKSGVRIVMVSDSCHSGTMARVLLDAKDSVGDLIARYKPLLDLAGVRDALVPRVLAYDTALSAYNGQRAVYEEIQWSCGNAERNPEQIPASVLLLAACQDNQTAGDGINHGLFTAALLGVWANGTFRGSYKSFFQQIKAVMPQIQSPNYYLVGANNPAFLAQQPFALSSTPNVLAGTAPCGSGITPGTDDHTNLSIEDRLSRLRRDGKNPTLIKGENMKDQTTKPGIKRDFEGGPFEGPYGPFGNGPDRWDRRLAALKGARDFEDATEVPRCVLSVAMRRSAIDGKADQEVYELFRGEVAEQLMKNYMTLRAIVPPRASGEISGGCSTKDGGSCEIHGTIRF